MEAASEGHRLARMLARKQVRQKDHLQLLAGVLRERILNYSLNVVEDLSAELRVQVVLFLLTEEACEGAINRFSGGVLHELRYFEPRLGQGEEAHLRLEAWPTQLEDVECIPSLVNLARLLHTRRNDCVVLGHHDFEFHQRFSLEGLGAHQFR